MQRHSMWSVSATGLGVALLLALCSHTCACSKISSSEIKHNIWRDPKVALDNRVAALLEQLTLAEKASLFQNSQPAIPRLGIKPFEFWSECLHGLLEPDHLRAAPTLFPQPLVLAATFDDNLVQRVFTAVSDELRAKNNQERNSTGAARNLVCWTPHMNLFRDPRWGRGSETYGEDPYLTSRMAVAVVKGLQGDHSTYTKALATCKHFYGYSLEGAEGESRFSFDADITPQDAADTYTPAFEACVREGGAHGVMCSYNAVNGVPSCANGHMLRQVLRKDWGFNGYVVSDCGAIQAMTDWGHGYSCSNEAALGAAVNASCDLMCDGLGAPWVVLDALSAQQLTEEAMDESLARTLGIRFKVGEFDPPEALPWAHLGPDTINSLAHQRLAHEAAVKGIVLLKNERPVFGSERARRGQRCKQKGTAGDKADEDDTLDDTADIISTDRPLLPLDRMQLGHRLCVVGPLADSTEHMLGNYYGHYSDRIASPLTAIKEALEGTDTTVTYSLGAHLLGVAMTDTGGGGLENALAACRGASVAVLFLGGSTINFSGPDGPLDPIKPVTENEGLDRVDIGLAGRQQDLVMAFAKRAPHIALAVVLMHAGPIDVSWLQASPRVAAILSAGAPGQEGGRAIADVLFGAANPSGRLPVTWYMRNYTEAVSLLDMRMRPEPASGYPGRSYRFNTQPVLYPFGHGLSYTSFEYHELHMTQPVAPTAQTAVRATGAASAGAAAGAVTGASASRRAAMAAGGAAMPAAVLLAAERRHRDAAQWLVLQPRGAAQQCEVHVTVVNAGDVAGEEVVLVYLTYVDAEPKEGAPLRSLRAFKRTVQLAPGYGQEMVLQLGPADFSLAMPDGSVVLRPGRWRVSVGGLHDDVEVMDREPHSTS